MALRQNVRPGLPSTTIAIIAAAALADKLHHLPCSTGRLQKTAYKKTRRVHPLDCGRRRRDRDLFPVRSRSGCEGTLEKVGLGVSALLVLLYNTGTQ